MKGLFYEILQHSLKISILFLLIAGAKGVFRKKLSPTVHFRLWLIFFVSLVGLPSFLPTMPRITRIVSEQPVGKVYTETIENLGLTINNAVPSEPSNLGKSEATSATKQPTDLLPTIWIAGVVAGLSALLFSYLRTARRLRNAVRQEEKTVYYLTSAFDSPFLYGLFHPKIIVPHRLVEDRKRLDFVLRHESIHRRRKDNFVLLFAALDLCFYWFLPFVWIAFFLMKRDMERSVDYELSKNFSNEEKADYANSILQCVKERRGLLLQSSFSKDQSKHRILSILSEVKFRRGLAIVVGTIVLLVAVILLFLNPYFKGTKAETATDIYYPYTTMKELSTPYLGNASAVGRIVNSLPEIEPFLKYRNMELKTTEEPYRLVLKFDEIVLPGRTENPLYSSPYFHTRKFNNALLLMMMIDNLSFVDFEISVPPEYRNEEEPKVQVYTMSRDDLEKAANGISQLKTDPSLYYSTLDYNNAISAERLFYARVRLGSPEEWLRSRWGEPTETIKPIESSAEMEPVVYQYKDEVGQTVTFRVAYTVYRSKRQVVEISVPWENTSIHGGEILPNIGIDVKEEETLKREQILEHLGNPRMQFQSTAYYRLNSGLSDYLYFEYNRRDEVIKYGVIRKNLRPSI